MVREHDTAMNKLLDWLARFEAQLKHTQQSIRDFHKLDRISEAKTYLAQLDELRAKVKGFLEEVSPHTEGWCGVRCIGSGGVRCIGRGGGRTMSVFGRIWGVRAVKVDGWSTDGNKEKMIRRVDRIFSSFIIMPTDQFSVWFEYGTCLPG